MNNNEIRDINKISQLIYIPMRNDVIVDFLINQFKEINIVTKREEWTHIKDFEIELGNMERKFHHQKLGYFDVKEKRYELTFTIPTLRLLRDISKTNDLELVKKMFSVLEKENKNPNITYYEDTEYNLTNACKFGQLEVVKFLVGKGVDIHVESEINIIAAMKNNHYELAKFLLDNDKRIDQEIVMKEGNQEMFDFLNNYNLYSELREQRTLSNKTKKIKV